MSKLLCAFYRTHAGYATLIMTIGVTTVTSVGWCWSFRPSVFSGVGVVLAACELKRKNAVEGNAV